ncbi:GGDEF domain-containing protein [Pelovirga terrestris]|uniref:Diguanylate cyclase n=1 Tax=Pelovirga terrestris TaxID=2771352 RepID=A0A8J6ULM0_9BACT|nr:GGDEF domain-containing protein [Pelovirga terrestris]MBD1401387.1 diguanylate cyclase [Pelovirga terrestris]
MGKAQDDRFQRRVRLQKLRCRALSFWSGVGLRPRLIGAFLLVSLIPLVILFFAQYQISKRNTLDQIESNLIQIAEGQQRRINLELQRLFEQLKLVNSRTQLRISLRAYHQTGEHHHLELLNRIIGDALASMEHFVGIWIRNPADDLVTGVHNEDPEALCSLIPPVQQSGAEQLQLHWLAEDTPCIWVSGPLYLEDQYLGSLHLLVTMADIVAVLEDFRCEHSGMGNVLLLPTENHNVKILGTQCPVHGEANQAFYRLLESPGLDGSLIAGGDNMPPVYQHDQIALVRQLSYGFGDVLVHVPPTSLNDVFWGQMRYLLVMTLFALALVTVMALALARMIARPLRELTKATSILHIGQSDVHIKERFWGEFAELTLSFNRAMRALSRRTRELNREVEARRRSQEKLVDLANTDTLTGLINRRYFMEKFREVLRLPFRDRQPAALLYIDLDNFKPINDSMGHEAGDLVLQVVAGRIRHLLREGDLAARMGGDEFVLLLMADGLHPLDPEMIAMRVEEQLSLPMTIKNQVIRVGCSIGTVRLSPGEEPHVALNRADQAMYRVKHSHRTNKTEN